MIFKEIINGKTFNRTLQNLAFQNIELEGEIIDLGSKSKKSSYYRFLKIKDGSKITFCDFYSDEEGIIKIDLEKKFPLKSDSFEYALLNNTLEHLYNYNNCISECFRILKPGGKLIGVVPFLHQIHPDPDDYFRYTKSALEKIFKEAGFTKIKIYPQGFGPVSSGVSLYVHIFRIRIIEAMICFASIYIDKFLNKIFPRKKAFAPENFPVNYFFICQK